MGSNLDNYEPVEERLARFWDDHPEGRILTDIHYYEGDFVVIKASVYVDRDGDVVATGIAEEKRGAGNVNRTCHVENCETSAIGRALANMGYAPKGARPSREEMAKAERQAEPEQPKSGGIPKNAWKSFERECKNKNIDILTFNQEIIKEGITEVEKMKELLEAKVV